MISLPDLVTKLQQFSDLVTPRAPNLDWDVVSRRGRLLVQAVDLGIALSFIWEQGGGWRAVVEGERIEDESPLVVLQTAASRARQLLMDQEAEAGANAGKVTLT